MLTGKSGDAVNWLQDKFNLDLSKVSRLGGHSQPRTHRGGAQFPGMTITYAQMERLEDLAESMPDRVAIVKKARVTNLIFENGAVRGVEYEHKGQKYREEGVVVLATGGYAADFDDAESLLKKHRPDLMKLPTTNGDHCTGDGQKMVNRIGGKLIDLEKVQVHPTGLVDPRDPDAKVSRVAACPLRALTSSAGQVPGCRGAPRCRRPAARQRGQALRRRARPPRLRDGPHVGERQCVVCVARLVLC